MSRSIVSPLLLSLAFWLASGVAVDAVAQVTSPYRPSATNVFPVYPIRPFDQSFWFDPLRPGSGWALGTFPSPAANQPALMAAAHYTFNDAGASSWFLAQSEFIATEWPELRSTSKVGVFAGTAASYAAGACPTCPYVPPGGVEAPYRQLELEFLATTRARVRLDGIDAGTIIPIEFAVSRPIAAYLPGRWAGIMRRLSGTNPQAVQERECEIELSPELNPTTQDRWERKTPDVEHLPAPGSMWFSVSTRVCDESLGLYWIAVDTTTHIVRGFPLNARGIVNSPEPILEPGTLGRPIGFRIGDATITEWYPQSSDVIVVRSRLNRLGNDVIIHEIRLERH